MKSSAVRTVRTVAGVALATACAAVSIAGEVAATEATTWGAPRTPEQMWVQEGRYWAIEEMCNGQEGLKDAQRTTAMGAISSRGAKIPADQGRVIADRERLKLIEAIGEIRARALCRVVSQDLVSVIANRAEVKMLAEEVGRKMKRGYVDQEDFDRLLEAMENGNMLMDKVMKAARRASS